jgi:hypothetical protein
MEQPRQWSKTLSGSDMRDHSLSRTCGNRPGTRERSRFILATPAVVADPVGGRLSSLAEGEAPPS